MKEREHIWIVEMDTSEAHNEPPGCVWEPTVGVGLTREHGREKKKEWEKRNPGSKFRIEKYERQTPVCSPVNFGGFYGCQ